MLLNDGGSFMPKHEHLDDTIRGNFASQHMCASAHTFAYTNFALERKLYRPSSSDTSLTFVAPKHHTEPCN